MIKSLLIFLTLLICTICNGQNLVPNPSFEDTVHCPHGTDHVYDAVGWFTLCGSSDYFNPCVNGFGYLNGSPSNFAGYQVAYDGNSYAGLVTLYKSNSGFIQSYREYLGIQLIQPLVIGTKYYASAFIARADNIFQSDTIKCATNKFGFRFSNYDSSTYPCILDNFSHIHSDSIIADTTDWTRISGSFTADSSYQYLIIGNFYDDTTTTTSSCEGYNNSFAYYYVDMVCVSTDSTCNNNLAIQKIHNQKINISPNPFNDYLNIWVNDNEEFEIIFYDVFSRKLLEQTFLNSTTVNAENLSRGIYIYEIRTKNKLITKGKIIKQ